MPISDLGSGRPARAAIINTDPKQLRAEQKFDQIYTINVLYVPRPPDITSLTQTFYIPSSYHRGVRYKTAELIAEDMGIIDLSVYFAAKYEKWLENHELLARTAHLTRAGMAYSDFA